MSKSGETSARPRVAVIGCGHWGKNIVRNFSELGALAALSDTDSETAARFGREFDVPARPYDEILADPAVDAIALATPASQHARHTRQALAAGKHVFVEKPLALTVAEGRDLMALARKTGRTLMVGHLLRYHPVIVKLMDLVDAGRLGTIKYLASNRLSLGKLRTEEDVLWSFAPHDLSIILALLGGKMPLRVTAEGTSVLNGTSADFASIHMRFADDVSASVFVSWLNPFKEHKLSVIGTEAHAVFDDTAPAWSDKFRLHDHRVEYRNGCPVAVWAEPERIVAEHREPLREECAHFLGAIRTGSVPRTDAAEALRVLSVLDAASRSMATGNPVMPEAVA
ncbi:MAG TPA: Gfo/Idh/MocA family oxidoreductase [Rhizomicrobium sp.]|jgi:UDP-2-acetamido-3-amino-2,3-dideoxy-glucuronate N-acetyltransferase